MWTCPKCSRIFRTTNQPHSCRKVPVEKHFGGKVKAKKLFDALVKQINTTIGPCQIIFIPCCIHLFGKYDFLAALPKQDRLEIRIALNIKVSSPRLRTSVPLSAQVYKNCFDLFSPSEIDAEFMGWLKESYHLKD